MLAGRHALDHARRRRGAVPGGRPLPHGRRRHLHGRRALHRRHARRGHRRGRQPPASPSVAPRGPTTASPRPPWKTASARATSDDVELLRFATAGQRRRRQVDPHRAPAVRLQVHLRGPARGRRAVERAARRRADQPGAAHRRPACRARAGHHHRRGLPLLRHPGPQVHHRRHPRAPAVHPQHGHGRVHGRPRPGAGRRPQRRGRAVAPPRLPGRAARHPARRALRQQDGPRRLGPSQVFDDDRRRVPAVRRRARRPRRRRRARCRPSTATTWSTGPPTLALVRRARRCSSTSRPSRSTRCTPPPGPAFPVQYVLRPRSDEWHDYRGYAGTRGRGRAAPRRRGGGAAVRAAHHGRRPSTRPTARSRRPRAAPSRCGSPTTSTSRAAT